MHILKLHKHFQLVQVGSVKLFPIKLKYVCSLYMFKKKGQVKIEEEKDGEQESMAETVIKIGYMRGVKNEFWKPEQDSSVGKVFVLQS